MDSKLILAVLSSLVALAAILDSQLHTQPSHWPEPCPLVWQCILQVEAAAHSANSVGDRYSSEHSQSFPPLSVVHFPVFRPIELHVPSQNDSPRSHLEGRSALMSSKLISRSLHQHFQSSSQMPEVCPRAAHPAEQAQLPNEHLNPAWTMLSEISRQNPASFSIMWKRCNSRRTWSLQDLKRWGNQYISCYLL